MVRTLWGGATFVKNLDCLFPGFYQIRKGYDSTLLESGKMNMFLRNGSRSLKEGMYAGLSFLPWIGITEGRRSPLLSLFWWSRPFSGWLLGAEPGRDEVVVPAPRGRA